MKLLKKLTQPTIVTNGIDYKCEYMETPEAIITADLARESGMHMMKAYLLKQAEDWCNKLHESASFHPSQGVKQGQIRTANELLEYLKK